MSASVELANPNLYASPQEYIEKHLAPAVAELNRLIEDFTALTGDASVDMVPEVPGAFWSELDRRLEETPKRFYFNGAEYESIPKELLRQKQLKVQLNAVVYVRGKGKCEFRLVDALGNVIRQSPIVTDCHEPTPFTLTLPFGNTQGCVAPEKRSYIIQARSLDTGAIPVCRRFAMTFVYI
jgi:hypothetical protein